MDGSVQKIELFAVRGHKVGCLEGLNGGAVGGARDILGHHRGDFQARFRRRARHRGTAPGLAEARAGAQRRDLAAVGHQGGDVKAGPHHVSDPRLALNGNA